MESLTTRARTVQTRQPLAHAATLITRAHYSDSIADFRRRSSEEILGHLLSHSSFAVEALQRDAWLGQISILKLTFEALSLQGTVYFEFVLPRIGRRIDVVLLIEHVVFVLEFKVGESGFHRSAHDQVWDYALDLKNFHEPSHAAVVAPVLVATNAPDRPFSLSMTKHNDGVLIPIHAAAGSLTEIIPAVLSFTDGSQIDERIWGIGRYSPTPTIVEAAIALYGGHSVQDISRNDAGAVNLTETSKSLTRVIETARNERRKVICFVTGVPGAGKTLVGLDVATTFIDDQSELHSVFLSGNGPLVAILREALSRDKVRQESEKGGKLRKGDARRAVETLIQNVHHFRDECLLDGDLPPREHVAIFDEAQRAWTLEQTARFMKRKKGRPGFGQSEPEFLISCLDRHTDWAVIICLVGGGQEINTGEAGISEWLDAVQRSFPQWSLRISPRLTDSEYGARHWVGELGCRENAEFDERLHLGVSMRSFRAENVSLAVKQILDMEPAAQTTLAQVGPRYPIVVTRDLVKAKRWLKDQARGSERFGIVVSSQAQRLKPYAIDVRTPTDPIHWFLDEKENVRSSFYLEDVATEFQVQGLELDWSCVVWDADFRLADRNWQHWSFVGDRWNRILKPERQTYLKNAYRVLLTRARQGMVIVVPEGSESDATRSPAFYDGTHAYLVALGISEL